MHIYMYIGTEFPQFSHENQTSLGEIERCITGHGDCTDSCGATQLKAIMKSHGYNILLIA